MCIRMCVQIGVVQSVIMNNKSNAEKKRLAKQNTMKKKTEEYLSSGKFRVLTSHTK